MKCALCGCEFDEKKAGSSCKGCFMAGTCKLVKCLNCGYENPRVSGWLKRIVERRRGDGFER